MLLVQLLPPPLVKQSRRVDGRLGDGHLSTLSAPPSRRFAGFATTTLGA
jgi:hypothetical protein